MSGYWPQSLSPSALWSSLWFSSFFVEQLFFICCTSDVVCLCPFLWLGHQDSTRVLLQTQQEGSEPELGTETLHWSTSFVWMSLTFCYHQFSEGSVLNILKFKSAYSVCLPGWSRMLNHVWVREEEVAEEHEGAPWFSSAWSQAQRIATGSRRITCTCAFVLSVNVLCLGLRGSSLSGLPPAGRTVVL